MTFGIRNEKIMMLSICEHRANRSREGRTIFGGAGGGSTRDVTCNRVPFNIQKIKTPLLNSVYNVMG